jgi:uncharacterized membrane protein YedE/YeeE
MNLEAIKRDDWVLGGVALLLAIDLLFLPWFDVSIGPISFTSAATGAPDGWLGVLALLAAVGVVADLALERLSPQTQIPSIGASREMTRLVLAGAAGLFVALKLLFHVHFSLFGVGFWGAGVLAAGLVLLTARAHRGEALLIAPPAPVSKA